MHGEVWGDWLPAKGGWENRPGNPGGKTGGGWKRGRLWESFTPPAESKKGRIAQRVRRGVPGKVEREPSKRKGAWEVKQRTSLLALATSKDPSRKKLRLSQR